MTTPALQNLEQSTPLDKDGYQSSKRFHQSLGSVINAVQLGMAESYLNGIEVPDSVLKVFFDTCIPIVYKNFPFLLVPYNWLLKESEQIAKGSEELMKVQYNLPSDLFRLMLGETEVIYPKYTMALWQNGALNLEQAQTHMLDDLIHKAEIEDGDEILDLGCGWGSAANYILSKFPNAKVTSLNLSHEQCNYIRQKRQEGKGYLDPSRFTLYEADFNDASFSTKFDKIIAIGLFEHIGNLTQSFQKLASFLKNDGKVLIHIITTSLSQNITDPFIDKYIFPNMRVWSFDAIPEIDRSLKTVSRWYLNGSNYSKTLTNWLENFDQNQAQLKNLDYGIDYTRFRRMWRLYLLLCIAYFDACNGEILGNGQYLMVHA
ncbi:MAG: class I SAM-dependent methyltransferase [Stenomitos rutilans HA7619-LM2]|jgi:cyclopropane-fatty-acyl-phospholipid synthase|nr:class I SAM-dependent methyltransferase [Stenomitos rutilans HA7619-LM2]